MVQVNLSTISSYIGISRPIRFGQIRNLFTKVICATISLAKIRDNAEYKENL